MRECDCSTADICENMCESLSLPCIQACSIETKLLPKPDSVSPGLSPYSNFPEDFELTKAERCKATCQTFCEVVGKPGHCPGMCELLFCYQNVETSAVLPSSDWSLAYILGVLVVVGGIAVHVKRS